MSSIRKKVGTFLNDSDGITMVDFLTIGIFLFFIFLKFMHIILSILYCDNLDLISQFNIIFADISTMMQTVIYFYFGTKTVSYVGSGIGSYMNSRNNNNIPPPIISNETETNNGDQI